MIADEPTTALDVTIQAEILALIDRLKRETGTAVMFITHDMAVVAQMADRVVVMYRGNKVEEGNVIDVFENPQHDYTKSLLSAVPKLGEMLGKKYPEPMKLLGENTKSSKPLVGTDEVLLEVKNLVTRFPVAGGLLRRTVAQVHAVEDVLFRLNVVVLWRSSGNQAVANQLLAGRFYDLLSPCQVKCVWRKRCA